MNNDPRCYQITFTTPIDDEFLNSFCPPGTELRHEQDITILSNVYTDQAGIIGLIRSLHNLGCLVLSMSCQ